jgi:hypothetical protein
VSKHEDVRPCPDNVFWKWLSLKTFNVTTLLGAVLSQNGEDKWLHPVEFHSQKFTAAEINYEIHDKELLAIVNSFQEWRHFLEGIVHLIIVSINHKNLEYFMSARVLNWCQAIRRISLSCFNFMIIYWPNFQ